jgi:hypothetical protein
MKNSALTEEEKKLGRLLIKVHKEKDFVIPAFLCAREDGTIKDCIEFIESNPGIDDQDVWNFLLKDTPPMEIVDDDDLDEREVYHG